MQWEWQQSAAWTEKSSLRPGSADATNCICLKTRKSMPGEAKAFRSADSWDITAGLLAICAFLAGC